MVVAVPSISVVVCAYNRGFIIDKCLQSLAEQTVAEDTFEVIVIDNNSTDNTLSVVGEFNESLPGLRCFQESTQGVAAARNRGLAEAKAEWVAFLDSDGRAKHDWLESINDVIARGDFDCFGGVYEAWHFYPGKPKWFDDDWGSNRRVQEHYGELEEGAFISGGNCVLRKSVAIELGGFPTSMGMCKDKVAYGEEEFLFRKMKGQGLSLGFVPSVVIEHCVLEYKYKVRWQLSSSFASGRDGSRMDAGTRRLGRVTKESFSVVKQLVKTVLEAFRYALGKSERKGLSSLSVYLLKDLAYQVGRVWGAVTAPKIKDEKRTIRRV